jgi:hypothetical protein
MSLVVRPPMSIRRIAIFVWLAAPLWATAQNNVVHDGSSQSNNFGPTTPSAPSIYQTQTSGVPTSNKPVTVDGNSGRIISDTPVSLPTNLTGTANATASGLANSTLSVTPAASVGPDYSSIPLSSDLDQIDDENKLQKGDKFIYQVAEDGDKPQLLLVDEQGMVAIPYLPKPFSALGLTLRQVVVDLAGNDTVKGELTNASLQLYNKATIRIAPYHDEKTRGTVYVTGADNRPHPITVPTDRVLTLEDVIEEAGGAINTNSDFKNVTVIHPTKHTDKPANAVGTTSPANADTAENKLPNQDTIDVADYYKKGQVPRDYFVSPGDSIIVPSLTDKNAYAMVSGEVRTQPALRIRLDPNDPTTVSTAIIMAGWTDFSKHTVFLHRDKKDKDGNVVLDKNGKPVQDVFKIDVDAIINENKRDQDMELKPGDLVYVDYSIFANR